MDDADAMRQRVIDAVNECEDIELLDLIYRILGAEARNGGDISPAVFCCSFLTDVIKMLAVYNQDAMLVSRRTFYEFSGFRQFTILDFNCAVEC